MGATDSCRPLMCMHASLHTKPCCSLWHAHAQSVIGLGYCWPKHAQTHVFAMHVCITCSRSESRPSKCCLVGWAQGCTWTCMSSGMDAHTPGAAARAVTVHPGCSGDQHTAHDAMPHVDALHASGHIIMWRCTFAMRLNGFVLGSHFHSIRVSIFESLLLF